VGDELFDYNLKKVVYDCKAMCHRFNILDWSLEQYMDLIGYRIEEDKNVVMKIVNKKCNKRKHLPEI
jgi:hypothetical protein